MTNKKTGAEEFQGYLLAGVGIFCLIVFAGSMISQTLNGIGSGFWSNGSGGSGSRKSTFNANEYWETSGRERGYNDSVPAGMSRAESNYIGNTAIEHGYNESEAKQIRSAINKFNQAQRNNK